MNKTEAKNVLQEYGGELDIQIGEKWGRGFWIYLLPGAVDELRRNLPIEYEVVGAGVAFDYNTGRCTYVFVERNMRWKIKIVYQGLSKQEINWADIVWKNGYQQGDCWLWSLEECQREFLFYQDEAAATGRTIEKAIAIDPLGEEHNLI